MSEPVVEEKPKFVPRRRRCGMKIKMALSAVKERKDLGDYNVDYKSIAQRFGVNKSTLEQYWSLHLKGLIDWGEPESAIDIQIDNRAQLERTLKLAAKFQTVCLNSFEAHVLAAEDCTNGDLAKLRDHTANAEKEMRKLRATLEFLAIAEKGFSNILEEAMARRQVLERKINGTDVTPTESETRITTMSDEDRGLNLLRQLQTDAVTS